MATFKTSAIVELVDKTKKGAASAIRNFGKLEKAADGFGREAGQAADKAGLSFKQFEFQQRKTQDRLNDLRRDLRNGKGDFNAISREIDDTAASLKRLNRENAGFRVGRGIGRGIRRGVGGALRALPIVGGGLAALGGGAIALTKNFAEQADEAQRLADAVGVSVEAVTALQFVTQQLAGDEGAAALPDALKELNKRIGELRRGEGTLLGIDKNFQSILLSADGTEDAFVKIRKEIKRSGIDTQQLGTLLDKTFGEAGFRLTRLFQASNEEFSALTKEAREVGVVLDRDATEGARKFLKELTDIRGRLKGIGFSIGGALAEPLANIFDEVVEPRLKNFQTFISNIEADDVERAFQNVAVFLEDAAKAISTIVSGVNAVADFLVTTDREKEVERRTSAIRRARDEAVFAGSGNLPQNLIRGTIANIRESGNDKALAEQLVGREELAQQALEQQRTTNRLLDQMLRQGSDSLIGPPQQATGTGLSSPNSQRSIGVDLDTGQERISVQ